MKHRPIIFLGPSLPVAEARKIIDADYRAPLRSGDLDGIGCAAMVGVIDGVLDRTHRIGTSEIHRALERGICILGAASTGALIASRVPHTRLQGVGRINDFMALCPEEAEDLVAVLYTEHDHARLTEPLVNAVLSYIDACTSAGIPICDLSVLLRRLRTLPLPDRSRDSLQMALRAVSAEADRPVVPGEIRDYKAADARLLLRRIGKSRAER